MKTRILIAFGIGTLVGVLGTAGATLWAQQNLAKVPSVITPHGFLAEEVRVGGSCVLIVSSTGSAPRDVEALPCGG